MKRTFVIETFGPTEKHCFAALLAAARSANDGDGTAGDGEAQHFKGGYSFSSVSHSEKASIGELLMMIPLVESVMQAMSGTAKKMEEETAPATAGENIDAFKATLNAISKAKGGAA
jgi:hypothetical protein